MWGYDAGRSGQSPAELSPRLYLNWSRELPPPRRAWPAQHDDGSKLEFDLSYAPVVMGDKIFVPSMVADRLTAYRIEDGTEVWRYYADGPMRLAPVAWNDKVYCVSDDGHLYCLEAASGALRWKFNAAPVDRRVLGNNRVISMWPARGGPVIKDGIIYFAAGVWPFMGTFVYAMNAKTGAEVWANTGNGSNWQPQPHGGSFSFAGIAPQGYLAATDDRLVVSGGRSTPAIFDRYTGHLLYMDMFVKGPGGYQVMADNDFFYHSGRKYSLRDGSAAGRAPAPAVNKALLKRANSLMDGIDSEIYTVLAAHDRLFVVTKCGRLICFGPQEITPVQHAYVPSPLPPRDDDTGRRTDVIISQSGARAGYALFLGVGNGALMEQMAVRTDLHIVGVDPDKAKIAALRRRFDDAGLYGVRIALLCADPASASYPPYISSLIVAPDPSAAGLTADTAALERVLALLHPYGGKAFLGFSPQDAAVAQKISLPVGGNISVAGDYLVVSRAGPLPGSGQWTHQYADAANTALSLDELVRLPLGVLWFGSVSHDHVLPRHAVGPRPQVAGGRLVILGVETISARDVYTGRELWVRDFPGIGHPFTNLELEKKWSAGQSVYMSNIPGAAYIGSPYVTLPDSFYLRYRGKIFRLDPDTGATLAEFNLYPDNHAVNPAEWGHISVWENLLITTSNAHQFDDVPLGWLKSWNATSSRNLIILDRFTGKTIWQRPARIGYRHNAIAAAGGRLYVIDGLSKNALDFLARRGQQTEEPARIIALDIKDGNVLWETNKGVFGTYLAYSEAHDVLLESGSRDTRGPLPDEPHSRVAARRGADGGIIWEGKSQFPAIIRGNTLVPARPGKIQNLLTGVVQSSPHPLTGTDYNWSYWKSYGCGAANASLNLLLFRSGAAGFADLTHDSGTGNFGGFKSGCTASMIAADGVLNAPDYTRTCTCSYQNQTSLGLIHMPDADVWTSFTAGRGSGPIRRIGVNLGAPGNRRDSNGTLWAPFPRTGAATPDLKITLDTYDFADTPVRVISATASANAANACQTLDGNSFTSWAVATDKKNGEWNTWVQFQLDKPADIDRLSLIWETPEESRFEIQISQDGKDWQSVYEGRHSGKSSDFKVYPFDAVNTAFIRLFLHSPQEKKPRRVAQIRQARIGALPYPEAYASFIPPQGLFREHSLLVDGSNGLNWVAASGIRGIKQLTLDDIGGGRPYTVRLHFAEPDNVAAGERVFNVRIQGQPVTAGVDVVRQAGGRRRALVHTFPGVKINDALTVEFDKTAAATHSPMLSGLEIAEE